MYRLMEAHILLIIPPFRHYNIPMPLQIDLLDALEGGDIFVFYFEHDVEISGRESLEEFQEGGELDRFGVRAGTFVMRLLGIVDLLITVLLFPGLPTGINPFDWCF